MIDEELRFVAETRTPLGEHPTSVPLVLLPVHLETRLVRVGTRTQVLVRIYPDDVQGDSHDPRLTSDEETWARHFWTQTWAAGDDRARQRAAWRQLVDQFGAPRATFIADVLRPLDGSRPSPASPPPSPQFPEVARRPDGWSRPAMPRGLPDSFVVIIYASGRRFVEMGRRVSDSLTMAPTMDGSSRGYDAATFEDDPRAGWLVDFTAAESAGMAVRVTCDIAYGTPLQRVLVFGIKSGISAGARSVQDLLQAHRYTSGLAFVGQSTPTNNTSTESSGYSPSEPGYLSGPLADVAASGTSTGDGSNAEVMARALGLDVTWLDRLGHAALAEQRDAYHMNNVLWNATWGYFLEQFLAGSGMATGALMRATREHFASYVRARGPLPVLRVGAQPYGVLPAISLDRWKPLEGGTIEAPLVGALIVLRDVWRRALSAVPRVTGTGDVSLELTSVLQMRPVSAGFGLRPVQPLAPLAPPAAHAHMGSDAGEALARALGMTWLPRQLRTMTAVPSMRLDMTGGIVQPAAQGVAADVQPLNPNYLSWLSTTGWSAVRVDAGEGRADTLLYFLARHAMLREYASTAARLLVSKGILPAAAALDGDAVDDTLQTPWSWLATPIPTVAPDGTGAFLDAVRDQLRNEPGRDTTAADAVWRRSLFDVSASVLVTPDIVDDLRDLAAFDRSLAYLATQASGPLTRLVSETIDLTSHRLDAWMTSLATRRLEWMRQRTPTGVLVGAYAWVEDVTPVERRPVTPPQPPGGAPTPAALTPPLYTSDNTSGYVHAPSLSHATTAAILRSGYLSRRASDDTDWLAVNLGSRRVRIARWLLDGIRSGQSLGALLGYRFERGLHEGHSGVVLDHYIASFRALAPLAGDLPLSKHTEGTQEFVATRNVVDGLALLQRYRAGRDTSSWTTATIPFGRAVPPTTVVLPPVDSANPHYAAIADELQSLEIAVDAIADITVAEAVHQLASGNPERAGAVLEAIAVGEAPPPDLDVIQTPRTGVGVTHRVMVLFSGPPPAAWGGHTPRSRAEPQLNAWAAALLGPQAATAVCRATYLETSRNTPLTDADGRVFERTIALGDLGLEPLDVVYAGATEQDAPMSEIEQRLRWYALQPPELGGRPGGVPDAVGVRIDLRPSHAAVTIAEVLEAARAIRSLLGSARPLTAADLATPDAAIPVSADEDTPAADEVATASEAALRLTRRADDAVAAFRDTMSSLGALIAATDDLTLDVEATRQRLLDIALFGINGAVPLSPSGRDRETGSTLHAQAVSVLKELRERSARIEQLEMGEAMANATARRDFDLARLREVFGEDFRVLPRLRAPDPEALHAVLSASTALQDGRALEAVTWLQRAARVRDGAARLDLAQMYAEALGGSPLTLIVGQLPLVNGQRWAGLPTAPGTAFPGGISLVVQTPWPADVRGPVGGLLVDEWVEVVPNGVETTGLTFHFNRPNARAPQAILLAVPPDETTAWDLETLEATLLETLELAKLRAVDPAVLGELEPYLPATYLAQPGGVDTVTTDLARLAPRTGA